jgi:hypothetical protein
MGEHSGLNMRMLWHPEVRTSTRPPDKQGIHTRTAIRLALRNHLTIRILGLQKDDRHRVCLVAPLRP